MGVRVVLNKARISFMDALFEAQEYTKGDGKPRYGATFIFEKGSENDKKVEAAIAQAAKEEFREKAAAKLKEFRNNPNRFCLRDGDLKEYDGYAGMKYVAAYRRKADGPPTVKDKDGKTNLTQADGRPYGGCYVNAIIEIYAQSGENAGIRAGLLGVQFHSDGDAFSSNRLSDDAFSAVEGSDADDIL